MNGPSGLNMLIAAANEAAEPLPFPIGMHAGQTTITGQVAPPAAFHDVTRTALWTSIAASLRIEMRGMSGPESGL